MLIRRIIMNEIPRIIELSSILNEVLSGIFIQIRLNKSI